MSESDPGSVVMGDLGADLLALAELVSLATWVEPGLLRRVRLDQLRGSDAGLEADLWFSPLVRVHNATGFALHTEARLHLRERLVAQPERLRIAWDHTRIAHAGAPPAVRLEEEITFLALSGAGIDGIEAKLKEALAALVTQGRTGLAQWAAGALPLFPRPVRDTETAWLLAAAASQVLGGTPVFSEEPSVRMKPAHLRRVLGSGNTAFIGVRWLEDGLEFGPPDLPGAKLIQVPRVSPVLLDVLTVAATEEDTPAKSLSVAFNLGERKRVPWEKPSAPPSVCILESERDRGATHELRRALTAAGVNPDPGIGGGSVHLDRLGEYLATGNPVPETEIETVLGHLGSQVWVVVPATPAWFESGRGQPALEAFVQRTGGARVMIVVMEDRDWDRFGKAFNGHPVRVLRGDLREGDTLRKALNILLPAGGIPTEVWIETLLQERHVLRPLREGEVLNAAAVRLRDRFTAPGPKRVLSLEGGGVRTASEFGYLARMEDLLGRRSGREDFRLADYFDLIGGSSSGSVIAACLAQRMSVAEAEAVWHRFVAAVFSRRSGLLRQLQHRFDDGPLNRALAEVFGNRTLTDDSLVTGLCLYLKRMDTGDTVALTNHPGSRHHAQRRTVMLRDALRAALAAPTLFAPVSLTLGTDTPGVYMDAAASVAADPAWHLFRMATSDRQPFRWPANAEDLLLVSVGAGHWMETKTAEEIVRGGILQWTGGFPNLLLRSARRQTGELLETFGQRLTPSGTPLSGWVGNEPRLSLVRYSVDLDADRLIELGLDAAARNAEALQAVDDASRAGLHQQIGRTAAEREVLEEHFPTQFDLMVQPSAEVA